MSCFKRIALTIDLPVEGKHRCLCGNQYDVKRVVREEAKGASKIGRLKKVSFIAESGEPIYAVVGEFVWVK